ncbi:uncharacterized protein LOC132821619 [Hemiscyllium ocellatum]|uniref:uncharacterized protein LOC132821619 n=1 Tax=Hemiscyllium ocellatum TaxID=170820 RepID=UPI00296640B2|nr:uncharacterized protein LOC132821619 [Hemiscyllium ocellatum]
MPALQALKDAKPVLLGSALLLAGGYTFYSLCRHLMASQRGSGTRENVYETQRALNEYLLFHFGSSQELSLYINDPVALQNFPQRCAQECIKYFTQQTGIPCRALDIGCAVGRASFEMARVLQEVVGIDYSLSFVTACNQLKEKGQLPYCALTEGDLGTQHTAVVPTDIDRTRCFFRQGDACNLPSDLGSFGCVLAGNLICRLPDPFAFFHRLPELVAPGGILVITSPYTWLEEFTPKSRWLGGYKDVSSNEVRGFDTMKRIFSPHFELLAEKNEPIVIRETARKHQWTVAHMTIWRRGTF